MCRGGVKQVGGPVLPNGSLNLNKIGCLRLTVWVPNAVQLRHRSLVEDTNDRNVAGDDQLL